MNLYNLDCLNKLKEYCDNHFDLAICDPPYGLAQAGAYTHISGKRKLYHDKMEKWDTRPTQEYFDEVRRVSKNQLFFGMNYFSEMLPPTRNFVVWDNCNRGLSFSQAELIWGSFKQMSKVIKISSRQKNRIHRCQKPVALYKWILETYSSKNEKILDTHLGSGSIVLACLELGFNDFTGFEINKEYFEACINRIETYKEQAG